MAVEREIAVPAGQGDSGHADPELAALLDTDDLDQLPAVFAKARLFVAVEPRLVEADRETGADKQSDMVLVTLRRPDGTTAVPAFTSVAALASWRASARPVPVVGSALAAEACQLGHGRVVLDVGSDRQVSLSVETVTVPSPVRPQVPVSPSASESSGSGARRRASRLFRAPARRN